MPRIYDSTSSPRDFCMHCFDELFPDEEAARERFGNLGDGPDDRGNCFAFDEEHPDYEGEGYTCENCRRGLSRRDN